MSNTKKQEDFYSDAFGEDSWEQKKNSNMISETKKCIIKENSLNIKDILDLLKLDVFQCEHCGGGTMFNFKCPWCGAITTKEEEEICEGEYDNNL